jgi:hypothetical protein
VGRDDELDRSLLDEPCHLSQQAELPLGREGGFGFVHQDHSRSHPALKDREKGFAMRKRVQAASTVPRVWIAEEIGVFATLLEEGGEVRLKFSPEKIAVARPLLEAGPESRGQFASAMRRVLVRQLVSPAATDRQATELGDRFDDGSTFPSPSRQPEM